MRRVLPAVLALLAALVPGGVAASAAPAAPTVEYVVVADPGVTAGAATAAVTAAGGSITGRNDAVGVYRVTAAAADFPARVAASDRLVGASRREPVGYAPPAPALEQPEPGAVTTSRRAAARSVAADPLDDRLWGLRMIRAEAARTVQPGDRRVTVGILDTGLDAAHPDLGPHFDARLSRNFAPDLPAVDGPCEATGCLDPVGTDDAGHGTHVAGTIGAALNGTGLSGVAPGVSLVELKGGQDSGYFFLDPVVNALTYAADAGLDVVNMSFFVDPWLYNCTANPADSPAAQAEQRAIRAAVQRALEYAHDRGVTLIGALGNQHDDLGAPQADRSSPAYGNRPYLRDIDNTDCVSLPAEGPHVIGVSAVGPSTGKAAYSSYGAERVSVAAPGGFTQDLLGTPQFNSAANTVLSTYPLAVLRAKGYVDADGEPTRSTVLKDCGSGTCGYYTYLAGTSMAAPHVAGVAALVISRYGTNDWRSGGLKMNPDAVRNKILQTAAEHACPSPRLRSYGREGFDETYDAYCAGGRKFNGFYGHGIVDAYAAVGGALPPVGTLER